MILTCPKCATSYTIDEAQLGPDGRNVRCQSCRATWFAKRPEEPIELMAPAPAPKSAPAREVKARELPRLYRQLMEDKKRLKALATQGMIWGGMTLVFIAILGVAYLMRVDIVKAFPSTAKAFASAGIEVDATGLRLLTSGKQKISPGLKGGRFVVNVSIDVKNLKNETNSLPPIRARLRDSHGKEISSTLIVLDNITFAPHATRSLSFDIADPQNLVNNVTLDWDLVAMKELREKGRLEKYYKQAAKREASEAEHGESGAEGGHGSEHDAGAADTHAADTGGLHPAVGHEEPPPSESAHSEAPALKPAVEAHH